MPNSKANDLDLDHWIERGLTAVSAGDWSVAWDAFDTARQISPERHESYVNLGSLAQLQQDHQGAIEWYTQSLERRTTHLPSLYCRGLSYAALKSWQEALIDFNQVIAAQPDFFEAYFNRGYVRQAMGALMAALDDFNYFLANHSGPAQAEIIHQAEIWKQDIEAQLQPRGSQDIAQMLSLARTAQAAGDGDTALKYYQNVLEISPSHREARLAKSQLHALLDQKIKALQELDWLEQAYPQDGELHFLRSTWLRKWGENEAADHALKQARLLAPELPEVYLELARQKLNQDPQAALQWVNEAIRLDPQGFEALTFRGKLRQGLGQYLLAVKDFSASLLLNEHQAEAYDGLETILTYFDNQIELAPDLPRNYVARANLFSQLNRYADALADWSYALNLEPHNPILLAGRARTLTNQGQFIPALKAYTQALELSPEQAGFYFERAEVLVELMRTRQAIDDLNRAIELSPEKGHYYLLRGTLLKGEEPDLALEDLSHALRLRPDLAQAWRERALLLLNHQDLAGALNDYRQAVGLEPNEVGHLDCAAVAEALGKTEMALRHLNQALIINSQSVEARLDRAQLLLRQEQWAAAKADLDLALELDPHPIIPWLLRAEACFQLGLWTAAASDASRALVRDSSVALAYYFRGMSYYKMKTFEQAEADLKRYLSLNPQGPEKEVAKMAVKRIDQEKYQNRGKRWFW